MNAPKQPDFTIPNLEDIVAQSKTPVTPQSPQPLHPKPVPVPQPVQQNPIAPQPVSAPQPVQAVPTPQPVQALPTDAPVKAQAETAPATKEVSIYNEFPKGKIQIIIERKLLKNGKKQVPFYLTEDLKSITASKANPIVGFSSERTVQSFFEKYGQTLLNQFGDFIVKPFRAYPKFELVVALTMRPVE